MKLQKIQLNIVVLLLVVFLSSNVVEGQTLTAKLIPNNDIQFTELAFRDMQVYSIDNVLLDRLKLPLEVENSNSDLGIFELYYANYANQSQWLSGLIQIVSSDSWVIYINDNDGLDFKNAIKVFISKDKPISVSVKTGKGNVHRFSFKIPDGDGFAMTEKAKHFSTEQKGFFVRYRRNTCYSAILNENLVVGVEDTNINGFIGDDDDQLFLLDVNKGILSMQSENNYKKLDQIKYIKVDSNYYTLQYNGKSQVIKLILTNQDSLERENTLYFQNSIESFLTFKNIEGKDISFDSLIRKMDTHFLLVDFWGIWCRGCVAQIPKLKELSNNDSMNITMLSLNELDNVEEILSFNKKMNVSWEQGFSSEKLKKYFGVSGFPYYILISKDKTILLKTNRIKKIKQFVLNDFDN